MHNHSYRFIDYGTTSHAITVNFTSDANGSSQINADSSKMLYLLALLLLIPLDIGFVIWFNRISKKRQYDLNKIARTRQYRENACVYRNTTTGLPLNDSNFIEEISLDTVATFSNSYESSFYKNVYDSIWTQSSPSLLEQDGYLVPRQTAF